jgi:LacI family transcriptional regulator
LFEPALTLIRWDGAEHGRLAAEILVRRMGGDLSRAERIMIPTELVRRGSCRPLSLRGVA